MRDLFLRRMQNVPSEFESQGNELSFGILSVDVSKVDSSKSLKFIFHLVHIAFTNSSTKKKAHQMLGYYTNFAIS